MQGRGEGAREEQWAGGVPGARPHPPLGRCAQARTQTRAQTHFPTFCFALALFLPAPQPPFMISLCQALSLWVSFDLCPPFLPASSPSLSPFLSLRSILPPRVPPSTALLLLPQRLCVRARAQHYLLCCIFTVPFLCIGMFRYSNTIVLQLPRVFSVQ